MSEATRARMNAKFIVHVASVRGARADIDVPFDVPREDLPNIDAKYLDILQDEASRAGFGYLGKDGVSYSFKRTQNR